MKKTTKRKITTTAKRVVKPPSQSVVLSLMALILIVGAPAIVSMIDDSRTVDVLESVDLSDNLVFKSTNITFDSSTPENVNRDTYMEIDTENNIFLVSTDSFDARKYVRAINPLYFDKSIFTNASKIVISVEGTDVKSVEMRSLNTNNTSFLNYIFNEIEDGVYEMDISDLDSIRLRSHVNDPFITIRFDDENEFSGVMSVSYAVYTIDTVSYSGFIFGGVGVVLLICALFATPWFGFGGIQKSKEKEKMIK